MRNIKYIVLHCTATSQNTTVKSIQDYWKNKLGWKKPGYHYIILPNGSAEELLPITEISNGVAGYNSESIHISYIGGIDDLGKPVDNRTAYQKAKQIFLLNDLIKKFPLAKIQGHRDFPNVNKACPSFDVSKWLKEIDFKFPLLPASENILGNSTIEGYAWLNDTTKCFGVVLFQNQHGQKYGFIGNTFGGNSQNQDLRYIVNHGHKIEPEIAEVIISKYGTTKKINFIDLLK